jgi:hypothetical protein
MLEVFEQSMVAVKKAWHWVLTLSVIEKTNECKKYCENISLYKIKIV